jgi:hypothetical protein
MNLEYKGNYYFFERLDKETDESLINRSWFVTKQQPYNKKQYLENLKFGKLFVNKKILNCSYNKNLESIINNKTPCEMLK